MIYFITIYIDINLNRNLIILISAHRCIAGHRNFVSHALHKWYAGSEVVKPNMYKNCRKISHTENVHGSSFLDMKMYKSRRLIHWWFSALLTPLTDKIVVGLKRWNNSWPQEFTNKLISKLTNTFLHVHYKSIFFSQNALTFSSIGNRNR